MQADLPFVLENGGSANFESGSKDDAFLVVT